MLCYTERKKANNSGENNAYNMSFTHIRRSIIEKRKLLSHKLIYNKILRQPYDTFKTGIPALLYTLQNNLLFISISHLDAATFQV